MHIQEIENYFSARFLLNAEVLFIYVDVTRYIVSRLSMWKRNEADLAVPEPILVTDVTDT